MTTPTYTPRHQMKKSWPKFLLIFALVGLLALAGAFIYQEQATATPLVPPQAPFASPLIIPPDERHYLAMVPQYDWRLRLVNIDHPLPEDFVPQLAAIRNGNLFDARAAAALNDMISAAKTDGIILQAISTYRSIAQQKILFTNKLTYYKNLGYNDNDARYAAGSIVAPPGTSEHNLGLAVDFITPDYRTLDAGFANTAAFAWLDAHANTYGFILRYPLGKEDITGIVYEPWHYRYVGPESAMLLSARGQTLDEYWQTLAAAPDTVALPAGDAPTPAEDAPPVN